MARNNWAIICSVCLPFDVWCTLIQLKRDLSRKRLGRYGILWSIKYSEEWLVVGRKTLHIAWRNVSRFQVPISNWSCIPEAGLVHTWSTHFRLALVWLRHESFRWEQQLKLALCAQHQGGSLVFPLRWRIDANISQPSHKNAASSRWDGSTKWICLVRGNLCVLGYKDSFPSSNLAERGCVQTRTRKENESKLKKPRRWSMMQNKDRRFLGHTTSVLHLGWKHARCICWTSDALRQYRLIRNEAKHTRWVSLCVSLSL